MTKLLLDSLSGKQSDTPPIWLMRQAGRYMKEYRDTRKEAGSFLDLCYTPELATEVTLQPIHRFHFDASIIFSDILVIPDALGVDLKYVQGEGPKLSPVRSETDIKKLDSSTVEKHLTPVCEALSRVKQALPEEVTLIGFAGSPWTVATYMVEGGGSKDFSTVKQMAFSSPDLFQKLIDILVESTIRYLCTQIEAGAEVIQLFDSWAGVLNESAYRRWVIEPNQRIVSALKQNYPDIPVIGFPKGSGVLYEAFVKEVKVDGVGIDFTVPVTWAAEKLQPHVCVQGNLDPLVLAYDKEEMQRQANYIKQVLGKGAFIFNLGHGIIPETPMEHVDALLEVVRG